MKNWCGKLKYETQSAAMVGADNTETWQRLGDLVEKIIKEMDVDRRRHGRTEVTT